MQRAQLLRQLVLDSRYAVDDRLVAGAILARATEHILRARPARRSGAAQAGPSLRGYSGPVAGDGRALSLPSRRS